MFAAEPSHYNIEAMEKQPYYRPVNWADGMKLNKDHFIDQHRAHTQQLVWSAGAFITAVNYGLLPPVTEGRRSLEIYITPDSQQQVQVRLPYCYAITPGGCIIFIDDETALPEAISAAFPMQELKGASGAYLVVLTVNPYKTLPVGDASEEELPPRLPYTMPALTLSLVEEEALNNRRPGAYHLCLGRIWVKDNSLRVDENYIPPCATVSAHPALLRLFEEMEADMAAVESYSLQIVQSINQKDQTKQDNFLAAIIRELCCQFIAYCGAQMMPYRWTAAQGTPVEMLARTAALARIMKNTLDQYLQAGREPLMTYLSDWCKLKEGEMDTLITAVTHLQYRHENIFAAADAVKQFMKMLTGLLYELSRLDYIGKKKDTDIFIKEEAVLNGKTTTTENKRPNFLGDEK